MGSKQNKNSKHFSSVRILLLPSDIASQMSVTAAALRRKNFRVVGLAFSGNTKQAKVGLRILYRPHFIISRIFYEIFQCVKVFCIILCEIYKADVIHWFGSAAIPWNIDVFIARLLNKTGIIEYLGSDIRIPEIAMQDNSYLRDFYKKYPTVLAGESRQQSLKSQRVFSKAGFQAILGEPIFTSVDKNCFSNFQLMRARIAVKDIPLCLPDKNKKIPLIIHMPSNSEIKGTAYVLEAIEKLKKEYTFDFKLIQNCPHEEAVQQLSECDIFLDQFVLGAYGVVSVEAMSYGKPVVCYLNPEIHKHYPVDCPIVNAVPEKLHEVIKPLLLDAQLRYNIGNASRKFAEKYHDSDNAADYLLSIYKEEWEKKNCR